MEFSEFYGGNGIVGTDFLNGIWSKWKSGHYDKLSEYRPIWLINISVDAP